MTEDELLRQPHYWSKCKMCGPIVICGKCGMNQCSGGRGWLSDGSNCDACEDAHRMMNSRSGMPLWAQMQEAWMVFCGYANRLRPHYFFWTRWRDRGFPDPRPWYTHPFNPISEFRHWLRVLSR